MTARAARTAQNPAAAGDVSSETQTPVNSPAIRADEAFGNEAIARRDQAVIEEQAARNNLSSRTAKYERDLARLNADFASDEAALTGVIDQNVRVQKMADSALAAAADDDNVVPIRAVEKAKAEADGVKAS